MVLIFLKSLSISFTKILKFLQIPGYQGIKKLHVRVELPKKKVKKQHFSKTDKQFNQKLLSERALNENVTVSSALKLLLIDIEIDVEDYN